MSSAAAASASPRTSPTRAKVRADPHPGDGPSGPSGPSRRPAPAPVPPPPAPRPATTRAWPSPLAGVNRIGERVEQVAADAARRAEGTKASLERELARAEQEVRGLVDEALGGFEDRVRGAERRVDGIDAKSSAAAARAEADTGRALEWAQRALAWREEGEGRIRECEEASRERSRAAEARAGAVERALRDARDDAQAQLGKAVSDWRAAARREREAADEAAAARMAELRADVDASRRAAEHDAARKAGEQREELRAEMGRSRDELSAALRALSERLDGTARLAEETRGQAAELGRAVPALSERLDGTARLAEETRGRAAELGRAVPALATQVAELSPALRALQGRAGGAEEAIGDLGRRLGAVEEEAREALGRSARAAGAADGAAEAVREQQARGAEAEASLRSLEGALSALAARVEEGERGAATAREDLEQRIKVLRMPREDAMRAVATAQEVAQSQADLSARVGALERAAEAAAAAGGRRGGAGEGGAHPSAVVAELRDTVLSVLDRVTVLERRFDLGVPDVGALRAGRAPGVQAVASVSERLGAIEERVGGKADAGALAAAVREAQEIGAELATLGRQLSEEAAARRAAVGELWSALQSQTDILASSGAETARVRAEVAAAGRLAPLGGAADAARPPLDLLARRLAGVEEELQAFAGVSGKLHDAVGALEERFAGREDLEAARADVDRVRRAQEEQASGLRAVEGRVSDVSARVERLGASLRGVKEAAGVTESKCSALAEHVSGLARARPGEGAEGQQGRSKDGGSAKDFFWRASGHRG